MTIPDFMDLDFGTYANRVAKIERLPAVFDFEPPSKPTEALELPPDPSTLSDDELVHQLQIVSSYQAWIESTVGQFEADEEFVAAIYRDTEIEVYMELFPDGKPKAVTVGEADMYVEADDRLREIKRRLVGIRMSKHGAKGYAKAYSKISMTLSQVMKYRMNTGDRPPRYENGW